MKFLEPPILIIITTFITSIVYVARNYISTNKNLTAIHEFLTQFKKTELSFRFAEFDAAMLANPHVSSVWMEFKNTLVFSESIAMKDKNNGVTYENVSKSVKNIQTTVDPTYFFNDETLVLSKYNANLISAIPTLLTGMGPLFTFLYISVAFSKVDFSTQENTISSVSSLIGGMQVAALCSVIAVGLSLVFLVVEKLLFNIKCTVALHKVQDLMCKLFDNISSEKFLIELLKETKMQNILLLNTITAIPQQFKDGIDNSIQNALVPYLENMIFGINGLKETIRKTQNQKKSSEDVIDNLF